MHQTVLPDNIQVVPGRAGGGSFRRKKTYIAKKEFAYRMCARRPTSAMPKPFLCCEPAFCCSMVVMTCFDACHVIWCGGHVIWCDVIACVVSCHVMQCDVMWCALQWSRCVFEVVLWQCGDPKYYSVLQSTTVYYKVLLQYYSVLQSTTPVLLCTTQYYNVLLCTTKYYSSTTLYCKVLLQYYSVLHSTTTYYSSTTLYYTVLLQYYRVLLQYYSVLQSSIHDWSLSHMKHHLQCAEQHDSSSNFTKYCACHAKWISWLIRVSHETSFRMRGAIGVTIQLHQILRLPRKLNLMIHPRQIWNVIYNARSNRSHNPTSPNTAPATQNESHDWSASHMKPHLECAEQAKSTSNLTKYCACHAKCISWLIRVTYETSFRMRGASNVNLQPQQILRLPRKMNVMFDPRLICKRHFQCAEQAMSTSNLSKYCACHEIFKFKIAAETLWIASANIKTIRG